MNSAPPASASPQSAWAATISAQQSRSRRKRPPHPPGVDRGITFLDNCWDYNNGTSEVRMGQALRDGYRQKVFLMTKMDGRTAVEYNKQLDESLTRLQTDNIDLVQFHEVIRMEDPDRIFAPGGAIEAAIAARQAGKIRYIGFTGHKDPHVHLRMLETAQKHSFHFDTVQMPINVMDAHFRSFTQQVMPVALKQGIGVLAMKTFGDHYILKSNTVQPIEALHYGLTQPISSSSPESTTPKSSTRPSKPHAPSNP